MGAINAGAIAKGVIDTGDIGSGRELSGSSVLILCAKLTELFNQLEAARKAPPPLINQRYNLEIGGQASWNRCM